MKRWGPKRGARGHSGKFVLATKISSAQFANFPVWARGARLNRGKILGIDLGVQGNNLDM